MDIQTANGKLQEIRVELARAAEVLKVSQRSSVKRLATLAQHEDQATAQAATALATEFGVSLS
jgi:hypothetical protein